MAGSRFAGSEAPSSELAELRAELDARGQGAPRAVHFLAAHVALAEDRRVARNGLFELFDASDIGAFESVRG